MNIVSRTLWLVNQILEKSREYSICIAETMDSKTKKKMDVDFVDIKKIK